VGSVVYTAVESCDPETRPDWPNFLACAGAGTLPRRRRQEPSSQQFARGPFELSRRGTDTDDSAAFVVEDGRYVSARWPGDAYLFAKKIIERLR
jgi:putative intracellular protease/amidase